MINRRVFCLLSSGAAYLPLGFAQSLPQDLKPYLEVKPYAGEASTVRVYFSPACQYSKQYLGFFKNLSASLPEEKKFFFTPLINRGDGLEYALAFVAVARYYPQYVTNFVEASLLGVQERSLSTRNWAGIDRMARAAQIPIPLSIVVLKNQKQLIADANQLISLQEHMGTKNTPAVTVAGTYLVTPEFTAGDANQFSQLVNALISMSR